MSKTNKINNKPSYIYGFYDFENLHSKNISKFINSRITLDQMKKLIETFKKPILIKKDQRDIINQIFEIFTNNNFLSGDILFVQDYNEYWFNKIKYFVDKNQAIEFGLMTLPFKIPNPLKTNSLLPDLSEILFLYHLEQFANTIKQIYEPGVVINLFCEGILGKSLGIGKKRSLIYLQKIQEYIKLFELNSLKIINLDVLYNHFPDFDKQWKEEISLIKSQIEIYADKIEKVNESVLRIIIPNSKSILELKKIYDFNDYKTDMKILEKRKILLKKSKSATISFLAFLNLREKLDFLEFLAPNHLRLALSPKPKNIGFLAINKNNKILPYHGVTLLEKNKFSIKYWSDLKFEGKTYYRHFLENDNHVFFYQIKI